MKNTLKNRLPMGIFSIIVAACMTILAGCSNPNDSDVNNGEFPGGYKPEPVTIDPNAPSLTADVWTISNAANGNAQWFKFTATAATQYIHFAPGTIENVNVELYDAAAKLIGEGEGTSRLDRDNAYTSRKVTSGKVYYIRVMPSYGNGAYQIGFNGSTTPPAKIALPTDITTLTANIWASSITDSAEQWFKFTATAAAQYIHFSSTSGPMGGSVNVQLYDSTGVVTGEAKTLSRNIPYNSWAITGGKEYYIRVMTPNYYGGGNSYQIGFSDSTTPPSKMDLPTDNVTTLTANKWTEGLIPELIHEQWFKFTAMAAVHYIHFKPGTVDSVYVQAYDNTGATVGSQQNLSSSASSASLPVASGKEYYIRVSYYNNGIYQIGFNVSPIPPGSEATSLTDGKWVKGAIPDLGEWVSSYEWFKFTATAATQYIHFNPGTLDSVSVQLYDSAFAAVGNQESLSSSTTSRTVTLNKGKEEYYIKVSSSYNSGTYQIAISKLPVPPNTQITELTANTWADGSITASSNEEWFKFTATAATHYIHFNPGKLDSVYVRLYDGSTGATVGSQESLSSSAASRTVTVTSGNEYYIRVSIYGYDSNSGGAYKLGFNALPIPPGITPTELTINKWSSVLTFTSTREQWFEFTATVANQYIYFNPGTLSGVYVQLYDSTGAAIDYPGYNGGVSLSSGSISLTVTARSMYYIRVTPSNNYGSGSSTGTCQIGFNDANNKVPLWDPLPNTGVSELTTNTWTSGSITASKGEEWFKFAVTTVEENQSSYIHLYSESILNIVYVQVYNSTGTRITAQTMSAKQDNKFSISLTANTTYYIRVMPTNDRAIGEYKIGLSDSATAPPSSP